VGGAVAFLARFMEGTEGAVENGGGVNGKERETATGSVIRKEIGEEGKGVHLDEVGGCGKKKRYYSVR
jgi:hypothetical protein